MSFDDLVADISFLEDWEDRYRYVIELGQNLAPMPDTLKNEHTKVSGCASQVWLYMRRVEKNGRTSLNIEGDSDAAIVKGLVAILIALYKDKTAQQIAALDTEAALEQLQLKAHLTSQRSNGLMSMINQIQSKAKDLC